MHPFKWLQDRFGWKNIQETLFDRKIPNPKQWGWFYTLGSATMAVFLVQVATGILLAMNYSPSPDHAHESILYIMQQIPMGTFIRSLHHWGASAMIILMLLHMLRIFVMGSYKKPRELTWILGIFLLLITFGLGFTGYLLPWDQKAYWATAVGINIAKQAPIFGPIIAKVLTGGEELGALTLSRFYSFHVLLLPTLLALLMGLHLYLVIYHGISAPPHPKGEQPPDYQKLKSEGKSFYPYSVFKDVVAVTLVIGILSFLAIYFGAGLEDPANPNDSSYNPRPEWYFLFLFQMLKLFPGSLETVAAIILPTIGVIALLILPFLGSPEKRHPIARPVSMGIALTAVSLFGWFTYQGWRSPLLNPRIERNPMVLEGKKLYTNLKCAYCHSMKGEGGNVGPDLAFTIPTRSDKWLEEHFRKPQSVIPGSKMPELNLLDEEIYALIAYLRDIGGGGISTVKAVKLFQENCQTCHKMDGKGGEVGPDLSHIGAFRETSWIHSYLENPQGLNREANMPEFKSSLTPEDLEILARWLTSKK